MSQYKDVKVNRKWILILNWCIQYNQVIVWQIKNVSGVGW